MAGQEHKILTREQLTELSNQARNKRDDIWVGFNLSGQKKEGSEWEDSFAYDNFNNAFRDLSYEQAEEGRREVLEQAERDIESLAKRLRKAHDIRIAAFISLGLAGPVVELPSGKKDQFEVPEVQGITNEGEPSARRTPPGLYKFLNGEAIKLQDGSEGVGTMYPEQYVDPRTNQSRITFEKNPTYDDLVKEDFPEANQGGDDPS
jgi:hypothetical protein